MSCGCAAGRDADVAATMTARARTSHTSILARGLATWMRDGRVIAPTSPEVLASVLSALVVRTPDPEPHRCGGRHHRCRRRRAGCGSGSHVFGARHHRQRARNTAFRPKYLTNKRRHHRAHRDLRPAGYRVPHLRLRTHCRDVVAGAVSNAGGFGVLGAIGFSPDELEVELVWLDEHVGDHPYGVDIVIPGKYEGMGELDPVKLEAQLQSMVPDDHRRFARRLLDEHGVPETPPDQRRSGMMGWTEATGKPLLAAALRHDKVRLIANALGTPPADIIAEVQASERLIGALAGSSKHALAHKAAGLDFIVCQGTEGGGHTGDVGSLVLWPEVIDAVALPVLAAGGVGSGPSSDLRRPPWP